MSQLTIFASADLEPRVVEALDRAGVAGFLRVPGATGNRFLPGQVPRTLSWEAVMIIVPLLDDEQLQSITEQLSAAAADCEAEPCLRLVATPSRVLF